jgi:hypothetical protein
MPYVSKAFVGRSLLVFLMNPVPLLLKLVILAAGLGLSVLALIPSPAHALADLVTFKRTIRLTSPARPANNENLATCAAIGFDAVRAFGRALNLNRVR